MYFIPDDILSKGPKHVAFLVQPVKGCYIRWKYHNNNNDNHNTNSHLLDITMMSRAFDQNLCVVSFIDHDSCVCLSPLGVLIDPQNMSAAVHIAWYFEVTVVGSNLFLDVNARGSLCYDTIHTTTGKPSASSYLVSALIISADWGTRDGMKEKCNNERQQRNWKEINAVNVLCYSLSDR